MRMESSLTAQRLQRLHEVEPSAVRGIVKKVWRCLDRLLSREFSGTHVLRRAGINRMSQVTLCIATRDVEQLNYNSHDPFEVLIRTV
jgi:hypothetical protein